MRRHVRAKSLLWRSPVTRQVRGNHRQLPTVDLVPCCRDRPHSPESIDELTSWVSRVARSRSGSRPRSSTSQDSCCADPVADIVQCSPCVRKQLKINNLGDAAEYRPCKSLILLGSEGWLGALDEFRNPGSCVRNVRSHRDLFVDDGDEVWSLDGYSSRSASRGETLDARRAGNSDATSTVVSRMAAPASRMRESPGAMP